MGSPVPSRLQHPEQEPVETLSACASSPLPRPSSSLTGQILSQASQISDIDPLDLVNRSSKIYSDTTFDKSHAPIRSRSEKSIAAEKRYSKPALRSPSKR